MFYSKSLNGFCPDDIYGDNMPADGVEVSNEDYIALQAQRAQGMLIIANESGLPVAIDPPAPGKTELAAQARMQRDQLLAQTDYLMMPDYPVTSDQRAALAAYRQALRDLPSSKGFPAKIVWPVMS